MNILFLSEVYGFDFDKLKEHKIFLYYKDFKGIPIEDIIENYDILIVRHKDKVDKSLIKKAKNLKMIISCDVENDNIDIDFAEHNNISVMSIPEAHSISVAELTIGLMLNLSRNLCFYNFKYKNNFNLSKDYLGNELSGKTLGIIGFGRVGREVAKRALSFNMNVIAYDKFLKSLSLQEVKMVSLDDLLMSSDIITLHIPLIKEDKFIIGKEEFDKMKSGVLIINASRSGLIDMDILINKLINGFVGGIALDSVESKRYVDMINGLSDLQHKILLTPHIGALTYEAEKRIGDYIVKIIKGFEHK
ncbi:MAG: 3-phosphoglycerate dehydrogenase [Spirochaetes bacterium]|nr:3-phosphoglycerate dehydrogenase [Spirochaetota bacterium]